MASKQPTYLYQRNEVWWYRQRLPKPFISNVIRLSLGTTDRCQARFISLMLAHCLKHKVTHLVYLHSAAGDVPDKAMATETTIPEMLHLGLYMSFKNRHLENCEGSRMDSCVQNLVTSYAHAIIKHCHQLELDHWQSRRRTEGEYIEWLDQLYEFKSQTYEASRLNDLRQAQRIVTDYFDDNSQPRPPQPIIDKLIRQVCDSIPTVYDALIKDKPLPSSQQQPQFCVPAPTQGTEPASEKILSEVMDEYLVESHQKGWKARTVKQYEHSLLIALHHLGDAPVTKFNRTHGRELRTTLTRLIKGKQQTDIENKGLSSCLTDDNAEQISVTTANNHMNRLRDFFRWAESMGYINRTPLPDDNLPTPKVSKQAKRNPIIDQEAKQIFTHPLFTEHRGIKTKRIQHASHFWLPLIAAYSGMRLGEIAQLSVGNIRQIGEHWCFIVEQSSVEHYLKTPNAQRAIPIHAELIRLGLLELVENIRTKGGDRLFNNIRLIQGNYSNKPSEWFIKQFRDKLGLPLHVTPHAFRHSVKDKLSRVEANPDNICRLLGHAGGQYGGLISADVSHLVPVINAIDYDNATAHIRPIKPDAFHYDPASSYSDVEV